MSPLNEMSPAAYVRKVSAGAERFVFCRGTIRRAPAVTVGQVMGDTDE